MADPIEIIRNFCADWSSLDPENGVGVLRRRRRVPQHADATRWKAKTAIRAGVSAFLKGWSKTDWEILNIAASGNTVIAERVDRTDAGGRHVDLSLRRCIRVGRCREDQGVPRLLRHGHLRPRDVREKAKNRPALQLQSRRGSTCSSLSRIRGPSD